MRKTVLLLVVFALFLGAASLQAQMLTEDQAKSLVPMVEKALQAYNAGDWKAFYTDFATMMAGIATEEAFKTLYVTNYMTNFGKYKSMTMIKEKSSLNDVAPLLMFAAEFEKGKATVGVNFTKEGDAYKLMQVQINKAE